MTSRERKRRQKAQERGDRYERARAELAAWQAANPAQNAAQWLTAHFKTPFVPAWVMPRYMRDVLDVVLDAPHDLHAVYLRKAAQLGYTTMLGSVLAWGVARGRLHVAVLQPTDADAASWRRETITPLFENIHELDLLSHTKRYDPQAVRVFHDSSVRVIGGTSPRNYRRWVADVCAIDERDALVDTAGGEESGEGDPVVLAQRAMQARPGGGRLIVGGTPTGDSRIMQEAEGAQLPMVYAVKCPKCHALDALEFESIRLEEGMDEPMHRCHQCGGMWPWAALAKAIEGGRWQECEMGGEFPAPMDGGRWLDTRRRKPVVRDGDGGKADWPRTLGFSIDGCYSPWRPWSRLLAMWAEIAATGDPQKLQAFVEQHLSRRFRHSGHALTPLKLREHAVSTKDLPSWCDSLVFGVDVQADRLSLLAVAFGRPSRGLVLERREFNGATIETPGEGPWREMGLWLRDTWAVKRQRRVPMVMCVDVGYEQSACLGALRSLARQGLTLRSTFPVKGFDGEHRPAWRWTKAANGARMAAIGQATVLRWCLPLLDRGVIRCSDSLTDDVLEELCALELRSGKVRGRRGLKVVQVGARAEAADALIYAAAWWLAKTGGARIVALDDAA